MHSAYKKILDFLFETKFKIIFFLVIFFYVVGLFAYVISSFRTSDPMPEVRTIPAEIRKEYRDFSAIVKAGLFINNFPEFDFINNHFIVDAIVWFEYNPGELMLKTIDNFNFENSKILSKSTPKIRRYGNKTLVKYLVKFESKTDIDFHRFPLEDHRLSLVLVNEEVTAEEMYFDDNVNALSFTIDDDAFFPSWKVLPPLQKISGYEPLFFDEYEKNRVVNVPKAVFTINFRKAGINKILIILVPIFAAIFLSLFTFLMSFNSYMGKYTLSITAITALLGYRFVIHQMSPSVGYFTIADKLFIFFLLLCFFIFAFQVVLVRQYMFLMEQKTISRTERSLVDTATLTPRTTEQIGSIVFLLVCFIFVIGITLIVIG
jgi:hypothetical protein